jgi:putative transposase
MTAELWELGWIINHKKVYRLMKEARLLYGARIRTLPFKQDSCLLVINLSVYL